MIKKLFQRTITVALAVLGIAFAASGCAGRDDVSFARNVMNDMIAGRYAARHHIAWDKLIVLENSIGINYTFLANDKEKKDYQCSFIENFKTSFKGQGATERSFVNWRMFNDADPKMTYVAADNANGSATLIFYVAHEKGKRKLIGIRAVNVADRQAYTAFEEEQRHVLQKGPTQAQ